jgi:hypothetical protein
LSELHAELTSDAPVNLDREWRFRLLCVDRIQGFERGVMFDDINHDANRVPREGAALASGWPIPATEPWGDAGGRAFGKAQGPYFRAGVHEIGHAAGIGQHRTDQSIMTPTDVLALQSSGTFPRNILWSFGVNDERHLGHAPDVIVRPGGVDSTVLAPADAAALDWRRAEEAGELDFDIAPLLDVLPLGAPARVHLRLEQRGSLPCRVPTVLSLKSGHVSGTVWGPGGAGVGFRTVIRCQDAEDLMLLLPGKSIAHDITLLWGETTPLFPTTGIYCVEVVVHWQDGPLPRFVRARTQLMVTPPRNDDHARAALRVLTTPDILMSIAVTGDHLETGNAALGAALGNPVLRPHFAVFEAKRIGHRFRHRRPRPAAALGLVRSQTVMSSSEMRRVADLVDKTSKNTKEGRRVSKLLVQRMKTVPMTDEMRIYTRDRLRTKVKKQRRTRSK